jgi:hypothetical protein
MTAAYSAELGRARPQRIPLSDCLPKPTCSARLLRTGDAPWALAIFRLIWFCSA